MDKLEQDATEIGREHGWNHANYVDAYGGDMDAKPEVPTRFASVATYFVAGWEESIAFFGDALDSDGTPRGEE